MATIGGITCDFVKGDLNDGKTRVQMWELPGISGYGAHTLGTGDAPFRYTAVKFDSNANIETWLGQIEALQGTHITIVDDRANTYTYCMVEKVSLPRRVPCILASGSAGYRCEIDITGYKTQ